MKLDERWEKVARIYGETSTEKMNELKQDGGGFLGDFCFTPRGFRPGRQVEENLSILFRENPSLFLPIQGWVLRSDCGTLKGIWRRSKSHLATVRLGSGSDLNHRA